jgi:osmotically inducible lipoprotein OsmB
MTTMSSAAATATCVMLSGCASNPPNSQLGTIAGAVLGGVAGSTLGGGTAGTIVGIGAVAGYEIGQRTR